MKQKVTFYQINIKYQTNTSMIKRSAKNDIEEDDDNNDDYDGYSADHCDNGITEDGINNYDMLMTIMIMMVVIVIMVVVIIMIVMVVIKLVLMVVLKLMVVKLIVVVLRTKLIVVIM